MALNINRLTFEDLYKRFQANLAKLQSTVFVFRSTIQASTVPVETIQAVIDRFNALTPEIVATVNSAGFNEYVLAQTGTDLSVEWPPVQAAGVALRNALRDTIPVDGSGFELIYTRQPDGSRVSRQFTQAQTAALVAPCTTFIGTLT